MVEKSRFKAGEYMKQINDREEDVGRFRVQLEDATQENKNLTVTREKYRQQNEFLAKELQNMEQEFVKQKKKIEE